MRIRTRQSAASEKNVKGGRSKQDKKVSNKIEKKILKDKCRKNTKRHGMNKEEKKTGNKKDNLPNKQIRVAVVNS